MLLLSSADGSSSVASVMNPPGVCMRAMSSLVMTSSSRTGVGFSVLSAVASAFGLTPVATLGEKTLVFGEKMAKMLLKEIEKRW
jgi:hypothetical protein